MKILKLSLGTWLLLIIIVGAFFVRLYKLDNPIGEWHAWRQADTASVSRSFYNEGVNPLYPKYEDMSVVSEIKKEPNLERLRYVEFPIYNLLIYFGYLLNGGVDERIARLVSIIISLGSLVFTYLIARKYAGEMAALFSAFFFAFLPFSIFYSRVILPEPILVFFSLGTLYFLDRWIWGSKKSDYIFGMVFAMFALLIKPYALFYGLPLIYSYLKKEGMIFPIPVRYFLLLPFFVPFALWRLWILQYPEGIPASNWLLNGNGIRFKPAFWYWIIGDRLDREILSGAGIAAFLLGIVMKPIKQYGYFLHVLLLSMFLFLMVFATGNVQHDYYQVFIIPAICIFFGIGISHLLKGSQSFIPRLYTIPLAIFIVGVSIYLSWMEIKGLYQINNPGLVSIGKRADQILPKDAVVIAPNSGDTSFLYYINRPGFPLVFIDVKYLIDDYGATHYVSPSYDAQTNELLGLFEVVEKTPEYVIIDLRKSQVSRVESQGN